MDGSRYIQKPGVHNQRSVCRGALVDVEANVSPLDNEGDYTAIPQEPVAIAHGEHTRPKTGQSSGTSVSELLMNSTWQDLGVGTLRSLWTASLRPFTDSPSTNWSRTLPNGSLPRMQMASGEAGLSKAAARPCDELGEVQQKSRLDLILGGGLRRQTSRRARRKPHTCKELFAASPAGGRSSSAEFAAVRSFSSAIRLISSTSARDRRISGFPPGRQAAPRIRRGAAETGFAPRPRVRNSRVILLATRTSPVEYDETF